MSTICTAVKTSVHSLWLCTCTQDGRNLVHYACAGDESLKVLQWLFEKDPTLKSKEVLNAQTQVCIMLLSVQSTVVVCEVQSS